jgi:hypothetical protein
MPDIRNFNNLDESTAFVWNTIVAPRYSNISNLWIRRKWWADGDFMTAKYFAEADLTENSSGKKVHVVLFKNGNSGKWIEFITLDKASFQNQFSVCMSRMALLGKTFSNEHIISLVAANDLPGRWYSSGSNIQYNVYTGNNAGNISSSNTEFIFRSGNYKSVYGSG